MIALTLGIDRADGNASHTWPHLGGQGVPRRYAHRACPGDPPGGCPHDVVGVDREAGRVESEPRRNPILAVLGLSFASVDGELTASLGRTAPRTEPTALP